MDFRNVLDRIIVSRTFTIHQLKNLVTRGLPEVVQKYRAGVVVIPGLLDLFEDPNIKQREVNRVIPRIMKSLEDTSNELLVITSVQEGRYARLIVDKSTKRIILSNVKFGVVGAELYNEGTRANIILSERELKLIHTK